MMALELAIREEYKGYCANGFLTAVSSSTRVELDGDDKTILFADFEI